MSKILTEASEAYLNSQTLREELSVLLRILFKLSLKRIVLNEYSCTEKAIHGYLDIAITQIQDAEITSFILGMPISKYSHIPEKIDKNKEAIYSDWSVDYFKQLINIEHTNSLI